MKLNLALFGILFFITVVSPLSQGWPWGSSSNTSEVPLEANNDGEKPDPASLHTIDEEEESIVQHPGFSPHLDNENRERIPQEAYGGGSGGQPNFNYDNQPQQSPFLEPGDHPTQSQGSDPRFQASRTCMDGQYMCRKTNEFQEHIRCIPKEWKCNGVRDCEENDDEEGCAINPHQVQAQCMAHQHTCYGTGINGIPAQCINRAQVCDGVYDCSYGDDENNCAVRASEKENQASQSSNPELAASQPDYNSPPRTQNAPTDVANSQTYVSNYGQQAVARQPSQTECNGRSEEYVKRLEWLDRCYRSCMRHQH